MTKSIQSKSEFVAIVSKKTGGSKKETDAVLNAFLEALEETFAKGLNQVFGLPSRSMKNQE